MPIYETLTMNDKQIGRCVVGKRGGLWWYRCLDCGSGAGYGSQEEAEKYAKSHSEIKAGEHPK